MATPATIKQGNYRLFLENYFQITDLPCANLALAIENQDDQEIQKILEKNLTLIKLKKIDLILLACTHYPLILDKIKKFITELKISKRPKNIFINSFFNTNQEYLGIPVINPGFLVFKDFLEILLKKNLPKKKRITKIVYFSNKPACKRKNFNFLKRKFFLKAKFNQFKTFLKIPKHFKNFLKKLLLQRNYKQLVSNRVFKKNLYTSGKRSIFEDKLKKL